MTVDEVMQELELLSKERMKKIYMSNGALEPLFGVATGAMKPLFKEIKINHSLAEELYATGNYDAMYFAGMIADPNGMTEADYERWMDAAYFYMISDFIISVTLAEAEIGEALAEKWIHSDDELRRSAGWNCYCWMLGNRKDETFNEGKLLELLSLAKKEIHDASKRAKIAMNNYIMTVGVSFKPLHDEALKIAEEVGPVEVLQKDNKKTSFLNALEDIQKNVDKGRIGFKRKHVRC